MLRLQQQQMLLRSKLDRVYEERLSDAILEELSERCPQTTIQYWRRTVSLDVPDEQADGNRRLRLSFVGAHKCQAGHRCASSEQLR